MATKKTRFNVMLDSAEFTVLTMLAKKQHKSLAGIARELIINALERHEDVALSAIADERISEAKKKSEKTVSHEKAWK